MPSLRVYQKQSPGTAAVVGQMGFKHVVVDVEGGEEKDIAVREAILRSSIKAIVPCDATKDDMLLPTAYAGQYDVIQSMLCLEGACHTRDDYTPMLKRLTQFLKPNGKIVLYHIERCAV